MNNINLKYIFPLLLILSLLTFYPEKSFSEDKSPPPPQHQGDGNNSEEEQAGTVNQTCCTNKLEDCKKMTCNEYLEDDENIQIMLTAIKTAYEICLTQYSQSATDGPSEGKNRCKKDELDRLKQLLRNQAATSSYGLCIRDCEKAFMSCNIYGGLNGECLY